MKLVQRITNDYKIELKLDQNIMPMSFFKTHEKTHQNLEKENGNFIWFQLFIEILLRLRQSDVDNSLNEFVTMCNKQYMHNERQLKKIEDFMYYQ